MHLRTLLSFLIVFFSFKALGQEPGIDSISIWPTNATKNDNIYAAVYVATITPSKRVSVTYMISGDTINITGCYATLSSSATMNFFADTLMLGKFNDGKYHINFRAYRNLDTNTCVSIIDSNRALDSFIIVAPESIKESNGNNLLDIRFPNPVKNKICLPLSSDILTEVLLYDSAGKLLKTQSTTEIDVSDLPQGLYFLRLKVLTEQRFYKFIKE